MHKLNIKPLSINCAFQGRRFKTQKYKRYISDMMAILPKIKVPLGKLKLSVTWGFSSKGSDIDNCLKCFIDCLQCKYDFNDNMIYELSIKKAHVKKGCDFIEWYIEGLTVNA